MSDGYEIEELGRIEDALDALSSPTSADVFQATRPFDERAIASVAAQRASGGGSQTPPVTLTGTDPATSVLKLVGAPGQSTDILRIQTDDGTIVFEASPTGEVNGPFCEFQVMDGLAIEAVPAQDVFPALAVYPQIARTQPSIEVQNNLGATVFRVDFDGTVHIKTGTSIVADL